MSGNGASEFIADDASLQRWGSRLKLIHLASDEVAVAHQRAEDSAAEATRLATIAETRAEEAAAAAHAARDAREEERPARYAAAREAQTAAVAAATRADEGLEDARERAAVAREQKKTFVKVTAKMADMATEELPVMGPLRASVQDLHRAARDAQTAGEFRRVGSDAETLPVQYDIEHHDDEERKNNPRGGLPKEIRADAASAARDN